MSDPVNDAGKNAAEDAVPAGRDTAVIAAERVIVDGVEGADGTRMLAPGTIRVSGGVITEVWPGRDPAADVSLPDGILAPGLVDIQVNGYYGVDLVEADEEGWRRVAGTLPETGVTAFLPTFITAPVATLVEALRRTEAILPGLLPESAARPLGVHLEGPFLSETRKGAHHEEWLCDPDRDSVGALLDALRAALPGPARMVTLAPERGGALDAIRRLTESGVLVSLGHSDSTAAQAAAGAEAGARAVTHLFNAQRPLHHREPGLPGQALTDSRLTCGLVADLYHVAAEACRLAFAAAPGRVYLVTDAASAAGMPSGKYVLGGETIIVEEAGRPPLRADGTLAGSGLRLDDAVGNMTRIGIDPVTAIAAATRVPADLLSRPDLGRIAPGASADLVWLSGDMRAKATWVGGTCVHGAEMLA